MGVQVDRAGLSDEELLLRTPGDPQAFAEFYDRYEADVLAFFWRPTGRADVAADLAGETFAAALSSVEAFDPVRGSARAWMYGIARHQLADAWERGRVERRARARLGIGRVAVSDEAAAQIARIDAERSGVLGFLDQLPEGQREAVIGRVVEGRAYRELEDRLGFPEATLRQRVRRGLRAMRARLEEAR
jgi:RNA polymerase sigma-70 factor (ECF subfamily)